MDLSELAESVWQRWGRPPSWLLSLSPHEFVHLFCGRREPDEDRRPPDRLAVALAVNLKRAAKGLPPVIPNWLLPQLKVNRGGPKR